MELTRRNNGTQRSSAIDDTPAAGRTTDIRVVPDRDMAPLTRAELDGLPAALDVPTAARVLGIGRTMAYELVRTGQWPTPVVRIGRLVKIPTEPLVALLGAARLGHDPSTVQQAG